MKPTLFLVGLVLTLAFCGTASAQVKTGNGYSMQGRRVLLATEVVVPRSGFEPKTSAL
jgi:hypothetical protein